MRIIKAVMKAGPAIPVGIQSVQCHEVYRKETESRSRRAMCTSTFPAAWLPAAKIQEPPWRPLADGGIKEMGCVQTRWGIILALTDKDILPWLTTWVDREGFSLSEVSQTEKGQNPGHLAGSVGGAYNS